MSIATILLHRLRLKAHGYVPEDSLQLFSLHSKSQYWVLENDWIADTLKQGFPEDFELKWDYSMVGGSNGQLMLEPGYLYTLSATVSIFPEQVRCRLIC